jgi:hypothetical protein
MYNQQNSRSTGSGPSTPGRKVDTPPAAGDDQTSAVIGATRAPECAGQHDFERLGGWPRTSPAQTWHAYLDPTTAAVVAWRVRRRCRRGCAAQEICWRYPTDKWRVTHRQPACLQLPLYRQAALPAAIEARATIYVTEDEAGADAVTEVAGAVAVTMGHSDNGKGLNWRPWHTKALAGAAAVTVCAAPDEAGYGSAAYIAGQVAAAGVPVRVVEAATGRDVRDHLAAGLTLAELVDITPTPKGDTMPDPLSIHLTALDWGIAPGLFKLYENDECDTCGHETGPRPLRRCPTCIEVCEYPSFINPEGWCDGQCSSGCEADGSGDGAKCGCWHHWSGCTCEGAES